VAPDYFDRLVRGHDEGLACGMHLRAAFEQLPHADNRLELYGEHDALGMARVRLTWRKRAAEHATIRQAMLMFGRHLIAADLGRVRLPAWLADMHDERSFPDVGDMAGFHHMGGTRMAHSPAHGVVDRNCRVFGVENLYVGGSSVFPTGGHANPTYSIVQLALRLADHLAGSLHR
jgi:choline dehydrogenase-like flavoprotein